MGGHPAIVKSLKNEYPRSTGFLPPGSKGSSPAAEVVEDTAVTTKRAKGW
jgi:hypothetical protein